MRVLIIGGNGQTGQLVVDEGLQRGHKFTALVRNPTTIAAKEGLTIVKGTPLEPSDIEKAFTAVEGDLPDAIIVTLASQKEKGSQVMAEAHKNLVAVMRNHGVSKIATLSSFGTGSSLVNLNSVMRWAISNTKLAHSYADHNQVDDILKKSGLNFVLFRPSRLTMAEKAPVRFYGDDGIGSGIFAGMGGISRASVAACLVDAIEKSTWDRHTPVISN